MGRDPKVRASSSQEAGKRRKGLSHLGVHRRFPVLVETVERAYPHLARWVKTQGWVEIGLDAYRPSFVRALDEGGMVWEGTTSYPTIDAALRARRRSTGVAARAAKASEAGTAA